MKWMANQPLHRIFCVFVLIPAFKIIHDFLEKNQVKSGSGFMFLELGIFLALFVLLIIMGSNKEKRKYYNQQWTLWYETVPQQKKIIVILTFLSIIIWFLGLIFIV